MFVCLCHPDRKVILVLTIFPWKSFRDKFLPVAGRSRCLLPLSALIWGRHHRLSWFLAIHHRLGSRPVLYLSSHAIIIASPLHLGPAFFKWLSSSSLGFLPAGVQVFKSEKLIALPKEGCHED